MAIVRHAASEFRLSSSPCPSDADQRAFCHTRHFDYNIKSFSHIQVRYRSHGICKYFQVKLLALAYLGYALHSCQEALRYHQADLGKLGLILLLTYFVLQGEHRAAADATLSLIHLEISSLQLSQLVDLWRIISSVHAALRRLAVLAAMRAAALLFLLTAYERSVTCHGFTRYPKTLKLEFHLLAFHAMRSVLKIVTYDVCLSWALVLEGPVGADKGRACKTLCSLALDILTSTCTRLSTASTRVHRFRVSSRPGIHDHQFSRAP